MGLVGLIILLIIVGAGLYLIDLVPIDGTIKRVIKVVIIVVLIIYVIIFLAGLFGLSTGISPARIR